MQDKSTWNEGITQRLISGRLMRNKLLFFLLYSTHLLVFQLHGISTKCDMVLLKKSTLTHTLCNICCSCDLMARLTRFLSTNKLSACHTRVISAAVARLGPTLRNQEHDL